jgi:hypothetical protein
MGTKQGSYMRIAAGALAEWLSKEPDLYWTVDGDPQLSGMLSFPCPGDELADALRRIGKPLLVFDREDRFRGRRKPVSSSDLDALVEEEELDARVLQLRWKDSDIEWILIEDEETSESMSHETRSSSPSSSSSSSSSSGTPDSVSDRTLSDGGIAC